jgi:hypothetical protein
MSENHSDFNGESEREENTGPLEGEFSIARSNALIPMLVLAAVTVFVILVSIIRSEPVVAPVGAPANKAFGPADFPMVFPREEALLPTRDTGAGATSGTVFPVPAPPFTEGIFPCMECHAGFAPNPERRPLEGMHTDIVLHHDEKNRWCLDCHDANDRNQLRLASGALIPFTESYRLCGQCHGTQFRDWRSGIHGKRTGFWDGPKRYLLCVHCHNPHSPHFAALQPLPPPIRPQFLRSGNAAVAAVNSERSNAPAEKKEDGDGAHAR